MTQDTTPPSDEQLRTYAEQYKDGGEPVQMFARAVLRLLDERDRMCQVVEAAKKVGTGESWHAIECLNETLAALSTD